MPPQDAKAALAEVKALTFDVFGTVVDWRTTVTAELQAAAAEKLRSAAFAALPADLQARARAATPEDWAAFAQAWRQSYTDFVQGFVAGQTPWKDVDAHHHDSLLGLLAARGLAGLYAPAEARALSLVWHRLAPWPDSAPGLALLGRAGLVTCALSNGNRSLLADLEAHGALGFRRLLSAEDFGAYKPDPSVYRGAAERLGFAPPGGMGRVAMVAAHLGDLRAARAQGMRTVYVERALEEAWGPEEREAARDWVDLWIPLEEDGFVELARRLGVA
ncbi:uncharacterized protein E0L32_000102 [Thyridium curvatum]|uniref:Haloacid dehalogenase n=1 Tax=Thyridium curvatum TaxID=1093900 RepID=A0A507BGD7_9PEZI|nr:uncharacterized protein E0L32_000102 [Thyridium curvatum]TPX15768.1 hypothetical protein E0L32_000102 [Thyridium curvatum]